MKNLFAILLSLLPLITVSADIDNPAKIVKAAKIMTKTIRRIEALINHIEPTETKQSLSFDLLIKEMINDLSAPLTITAEDVSAAPKITPIMTRRMKILRNQIEPTETIQHQSFDTLIKELIDDLPRK